MSKYIPELWIYISGQVVYPHRWGPLRDSKNLVLDDFRIDWGVKFLKETEPARLSLRLFDASGEYLDDKYLLTEDISIIAMIRTPTGGYEQRTMFRGQITDVKTTPRDMPSERSNATSQGWIIEITAVDRLGQMGNAMINGSTDGTEAGEARFINSIVSQTGNIVSTITRPARLSGAWMMKKDITNENALSFLQKHYAAQVQYVIYNPASNAIEGVPMTDSSISRQLVFQKISTAADAMVKIVPLTYANNTWSAGLNLQASTLESDGTLTWDLEQAVTRVNVKYYRWDSAASDYKEETTSLAVKQPRGRNVGVRTMFRDTDLVGSVGIGAAKLVEALEQSSGYPKIENLSFRTQGFDTLKEAQQWIIPTLSSLPLVITGSIHNRRKQVSKLYLCLGSTIRYRRKTWEISPVLQPIGDIRRETTGLYAPITFKTMEWDATKTTTDMSLRRFDPSITFKDTKEVSRVVGAG